MSNASIKNAFERMWQHVIMAISSKAAPAGYGLGETNYSNNTSVATAAEVDELVHNGWYQFTGTDDTILGMSTCAIQVIASRYGITQIIYVNHSNLSANGIMAMRSRYNTSSWDGVTWEYINPPMSINTEYRTTERWEGKPVYRKLIKYTNATALSGNASISIPHGIEDLNMVISAFGTTTQYLLPYVSSSTSLNLSEWSHSYLYLYNGNSTWSAGRNWYIEIRYIKDGQ